MALRSIFDASAIRTEFENSGINSHFIPLIWKYAIQNPNCELDEVPSLPSSAYPLLQSKFKPFTSTLHSVFDSSDGVTTKLLIKLQNGAFVEAVIMRYDTRLGKYGGQPRPGGPRLVAKWVANSVQLEAWDLKTIYLPEKLWNNWCMPRNGEPLNNYTALVEAIRVMTGLPFQLSPKRITVSTVGIIHAIKKLQSDIPSVNLAVSLHAPLQNIRCQIMPAARAFPLERLMDTLREYQKNSQQKIFIEYIMLDGVNDEEQHAHQLGKLLETFEVVVNLIPFNPIGTLSHFRTSSEQKVTTFQKILRGTYNIRTTIRKQMGQDISGACGQLVVNLPDKRSTGSAGLLTDIEDLRL
ncbi:radical SAM superfamily protein [Actinidia rufa]|uniref:Radical SAM superfamily protein n=1 Tax=Actinidia rufa TaxID=165716 RepID=A0A7J0H1A0_9ERIC|nr:radical SAM superfamily protein [Actinidia rufa]